EWEEESPYDSLMLREPFPPGDDHLSRHLWCERGFCPEGDPWGSFSGGET
nr:hypothetical protein [Tanacetum cinerariifolium]